MYWMRTAVRTDHNPALIDLELAQKHNPRFLCILPSLNTAASRRHHQFILEGAKISPRSLKIWISVLLSLSKEKDTESPLTNLASNTRVVVTEECPFHFYGFGQTKLL